MCFRRIRESVWSNPFATQGKTVQNTDIYRYIGREYSAFQSFGMQKQDETQVPLSFDRIQELGFTGY